MSCPLSSDHLTQLKQFIELCDKNPDFLHHPDLAFFKNYLESLGANIPILSESNFKTKTEKAPEPEMQESESNDSEPESDLDIDMDGCVEPDKLDDSQIMPEVGEEEPSEENIDKADEKRIEAMGQFSEGNFEDAVKLYSEGLTLNPSSALLYAKRGQAYLKLGRPNACIRDCTRALELNCDSAAAYKFRGRAHRLLADWEKAAADLRQACNIDLDEQTDEWLREVTPNATKLQQHKLKIERKRAEKEQKEKQERIRKAREANAKAAADNAEQRGSPTENSEGGANDFFQFWKDPEVMKAFEDPEVAAAFQDISTNPSNFLKYQSNPKIAALIAKLASKFPAGGMGGFPGMGGMGGMGAGMGGMGAGMGGAPGSGTGFPSGPNGDDVGLD